MDRSHQIKVEMVVERDSKAMNWKPGFAIQVGTDQCENSDGQVPPDQSRDGGRARPQGHELETRLHNHANEPFLQSMQAFYNSTRMKAMSVVAAFERWCDGGMARRY